MGCIDEELADFFDVNKDTIYEWQRQYPSFSDSIRKGKIIADANVAQALYKRSIGYEFTETSKKITPKLTETTESIKHIPADVKAAKIWLNNRQRKKWKQNPDNFNDDGERTGYNIVGFVSTGLIPIESESDIKDHLDDADI